MKHPSDFSFVNKWYLVQIYLYWLKELMATSIKSYLTDRTQWVSVTPKKQTSSDVCLLSGVQQGSVLGTKNGRIHTKPVGEIIKRHNIKYNYYADDTKVYITWKPRDKLDDISSSIEACITDISTWMNSDMLKLNTDKR